MFMTFITRTLIFSTTFILSSLSIKHIDDTIPYSPSETIIENGRECINTLSDPLLILACFIRMTNTLNTNILKARAFKSLAVFFHEHDYGREENMAMASAQQYEEFAKNSCLEEANILRQEIQQLETYEAYPRIMNLLFKFKNSNLAPINTLIQHYSEKSEQYAKEILKSSDSPNDVVNAYQVLTQSYLLTDNCYAAFFTTRAAISTLEFYQATKDFSDQYGYFKKQHEFCKNKQ
ncbi:MAG: hypothetical protein LRY67_03250 [Gammaproteobacteria bacterium]|nr:hypothetical protein [Gammaproteobacteria bacterium]MCD8542174.1 hypothetical protein [Gammaproteobacteria bacterium]